MANARNSGRQRRDAGRDGGGFVALPNIVVDSPAFRSLSYAARALLVDVARQYVPGKNGLLVCSMSHLGPLGWSSNETITRAKRELLATGLLYETRRGARPSTCGLYAVGWRAVDASDRYDHDVLRVFRRGAYLQPTPAKNEVLTPMVGVGGAATAPVIGVERSSTAPITGALGPV